MNNFRSVSIADDRTREAVICGYRPTRKTIQVIRAICGNEHSTATHVVAPYGAGKSLAALAGITLMAGDAAIARKLHDRVSLVDPDLAAVALEANNAAQVLLLHGFCPSLKDALAERAGVTGGSLTKVLSAMERHARDNGIERIAIVWDEFNQHLETLVREGRPDDLLAIQNLAEWVVRQARPRVTLTTLMHQGVYHYIRRVSNTAQSEWKKVEGRFETVSLLEDGVDAFEMLAEVLDCDDSAPNSAAISRVRAAGFFSEVPDDKHLTDILTRTSHLTPAALATLPRLASQVAQSERTMFGFISDVVIQEERNAHIHMGDLYDFFSPSMRSDTGPGGTHRRFVEAETALSRTETDLERKIVKSATLLRLGRSSEKLRLPLARLIYAVAEGTDLSVEVVASAIEALVARKVLLHRRRLDDISVWHGSDIDLGKLVSEEASRLGIDSDPLASLSRLFPPDAYTAPLYNYDHGITRFARARFVRAAELASAQNLEDLISDANLEDALVALVFDATADQKDVLEIARGLPPQLILALPRRRIDIGPILADLTALEALFGRREILDADPLIEHELRELQADAEAALRQNLERLMNPDRGDVVWVSGSTSHIFDDSVTSGEVLSNVFKNRFPSTPLITNEQVVRRTVSAVTRSARKRCILAILERTGIRSLGYEGATSADASIYRTVLERTGLYSNRSGSWQWSSPSNIANPCMRVVWKKIQTFFAISSPRPKSVEDLLDQLTAPPIGLREGVLPLLLAAGMTAFSKAMAIREQIDGRARYVDDVQPSVIERMCQDPRAFELEVPLLSARQTESLERMIRCLVGTLDPHEPDLVRSLYDALIEWKTGLPVTALRTRGLGKRASRLQPLLRKKHFDPVEFLFRGLPLMLDEKPLSPQTVAFFSQAVLEIESVASTYADQAVRAATIIFNSRLSGDDRPLLEAAAEWAAYVPIDNDTLRTLDHEARGLVARARSTISATWSEREFATRLSGILCGEGFNAWDDDIARRFQLRLKQAVMRIEDTVLDSADDSDAFEPFLRNRLATAFETYGAKIGRERLLKYLDEIYRGSS